MKKEAETVTLHTDALLRESLKQTASMRLPLAVSLRLDALTEMASPLKATRAEVVGALVAAARLKPDEIEALVLGYQKMVVGEVLPGSSQSETEAGDGDDVVVPLRQPGRPRRTSD